MTHFVPNFGMPDYHRDDGHIYCVVVCDSTTNYFCGVQVNKGKLSGFVPASSLMKGMPPPSSDTPPLSSDTPPLSSGMIAKFGGFQSATCLLPLGTNDQDDQMEGERDAGI